jgi:hypothetical protein
MLFIIFAEQNEAKEKIVMKGLKAKKKEKIFLILNIHK